MQLYITCDRTLNTKQRNCSIQKLKTPTDVLIGKCMFFDHTQYFRMTNLDFPQMLNNKHKCKLRNFLELYIVLTCSDVNLCLNNSLDR